MDLGTLNTVIAVARNRGVDVVSAYLLQNDYSVIEVYSNSFRLPMKYRIELHRKLSSLILSFALKPR